MDKFLASEAKNGRNTYTFRKEKDLSISIPLG
jgi:hypothetical protein